MKAPQNQDELVDIKPKHLPDPSDRPEEYEADDDEIFPNPYLNKIF